MKNKIQLQGELKSTGTAWILFLFLTAHYAYVNRWGIQLLFWCTLGGFGIWAFVDLFCINGMIRNHNAKIYKQIEEIDELKHQRSMETIFAMRNN